MNIYPSGSDSRPGGRGCPAGSFISLVRETAPLVHCITNFVTVNDCANIVLAAGGSPTMSRDPREVEEITSGCHALVLNMGTVSDPEAMLLAGRRAKMLGHPVILDPVGAGASRLRRDTAATLLREVRPDVIRGNASEIRYLYDGGGQQAGGIDAALSDRITKDNLRHWARLAHSLAVKLECAVCISGAVDIAADPEQVYYFRGGCQEMSRITGSGCMTTALMGAYLGAAFRMGEVGHRGNNNDRADDHRADDHGPEPRGDKTTGNDVRRVAPDRILEAIAAAQSVMNAAGDLALAKTKAAGGGTMTFRLHLIDAVSLMNEDLWNEYAKIDELSLRDL